MQSETGFPSSHQLKSCIASKSRLKLAARAVLSADAGLLVSFPPLLLFQALCITYHSDGVIVDVIIAVVMMSHVTDGCHG